MINWLDIAYAGAVVAGAPYWLLRGRTRRKVLRALRERMGHVPARTDDAPAVMIHAVSLGEMNATRALVRELGERRPELRFIISSTTDTGYERGRQLYAGEERVTLIRYPLDFSPAVERVLAAQRPSVVVLMELEVWPNFLKACERRGVPVVLVNGRLTESSFRKYRLAGPLVRPMFRRLARVCAQDETYAQRFIELGALPERVGVTGTMKFDTAEVGERVAGDGELAAAVGLERKDKETRGQGDKGNSVSSSPSPIWVCGSTGPGEEEIVLTVYERLRHKFPGLRLAIVPRKPERFEEVAELIRARGFALLRRSQEVGGRQSAVGRDAVVLGDTMGELRKFYSLADVVFVGRTLVDLGPRQHGSDMIEPAALEKAVVVGPFTGNFADAMRRFRDAGAIHEVSDARGMEAAVRSLLSDRSQAEQMGERAREVVRSQQGATGRHVGVVVDLLGM